MTASRLFMNVYAVAAICVTVAGLAWTLIAPPQSMRTDRNGVAHFTPQVEHPVTGEGVGVNELIKNYRGD